jgi:hypothetical protein
MSPFLSPTITSAGARATSAVCTLAIAAVALALTAFRYTPPAPDAPAAERVELRYTARFDGVGAEGVDNVWVGELSGSTPGEITIRVEHLGAEADRARAVWPVRVLTFVAADDAARSFAADLDGVLDWTTGTMQVSGTIDVGWRAGAPVEQTFHLDRVQYDGRGALRVGALTAAR